MVYEPRNFDHLIGLEGLSEVLLKNHFALYQGYVVNTNKLVELSATLLKEGEIATPEYAELKRRFGWEFNGMRLHEYYFENLIKNGVQIDKSSKFFQKITRDFGSFENWEKDFGVVATMRGIGWVILYYDPLSNQLLNTWINEHDTGHLSGLTPLLVVDVFEHAYILDYGIKRADYIEAVSKIINWEIVGKRFNGTV